VLDDIPNADRKSDRLLATLPPRSPTIQRDEDGATVSKLRTSKSEYNVSRSKSSVTHGATVQPERTRLATSISVGNSLSTRAGPAAAIDAVGSWKVHEINEAREPQNASSSYKQGRVHTNDDSGVAASALGRAKSASQQTRTYSHRVGSGWTRTDRDQQKQVFSANSDSVPQAVSSNSARPRSVPPKLLHQSHVVHEAQYDDSMGAQYEPGNVRHLVQTFQSALRPALAVEQTSVHAGACRPAGEMSTARDRLQTADKRYHRQTGRDDEQRWPSGQRYLHAGAPRADAVNVCVVRPATGRSLPQPPAADHSQSLTACRPSTPGSQELQNERDQSDTQCSNKASKLWQAYGCL